MVLVNKPLEGINYFFDSVISTDEFVTYIKNLQNAYLMLHLNDEDNLYRLEIKDGHYWLNNFIEVLVNKPLEEINYFFDPVISLDEFVTYIKNLQNAYLMLHLNDEDNLYRLEIKDGHYWLNNFIDTLVQSYLN
ncbi:hypothetical protein LG651_02615 [Tamlana sp. 62-3]|uniref:Uncharacterized protein n=1 Tax=Neotamlana sargassicola TaxID=2883125 RepID=A0A9X1I411_9FLAO|nr:hypothetical protein [Tamlana sargassicola]MCB4807128.1 hypothetical protein [Tamlana sargassicola]